MSVPGYSAWSVTAGEQPTTAYWNILGSNDAAFNTFLSNPNILSSLLALSSGFSGGVTSLANAGTAGGTMHYINLGGIKLLWGTTGTLSVSGSGAVSTNYTVTFPASFFSTIQASGAFCGGGQAANTQYATITDDAVATTSGMTFYFSQWSGTNANGTAMFFAIGT